MTGCFSHHLHLSTKNQGGVFGKYHFVLQTFSLTFELFILLYSSSYICHAQGPLSEHGVDPGGEQERADDVSTPGWLHSTGTVTQIQ